MLDLNSMINKKQKKVEVIENNMKREREFAQKKREDDSDYDPLMSRASGGGISKRFNFKK